MKARLILLGLGLCLATIVSFELSGQERGAIQAKDDIITNEQQLERQFAEFQDALLKLKQRLARGTPEERKRAEVLDKVLEECKNLAIKHEFTKMLEILRGANLRNPGDIEKTASQSEVLTNKLRTILDMLQNSKLDLSSSRKDLQKIIEDLQRAIDGQRQTQAQTERGTTESKELENIQKGETKKTEKVADDIDKYLKKDGKGKGGEAANLKGENKEGKGEGKPGESKDAGKPKGGESSKGEPKDAGAESKSPKGEAKPGDDKGGKGAKSGDQEPKSGAKPGSKGQEGSPEAGAKKNEKPDAKGNEGSAKENKPGQKSDKGAEGGAKDSGNKDPMKKDEQGSAKGSESKESKPSSGDNKPQESSAKGGGDPMGGGDKPQANAKVPDASSPKGGDAKGGDAKGGEGGQGDAKSGDSKDGQGTAKDGGGSAGAGGGSPPPGGQAKDSPPPGGGQPPPPGGNKQDDDVAKSGKKVQEAGYDQKIAEDKIKQKQNEAAAKVQGDAIKKMEEAKKKLEKLLQQMREEEIERVLAALQARCEKMLIMQLEVEAGTKDLHATIQKNVDKKPTQPNKLESLKLSDKEKAIVQEADKCIDILESEGTAVAFPEVFQQLRQDMRHVQKRLEVSDAGEVTQGIEADIITTLKEMIDALKKARDENQDPSAPKPGKAGKSGKPGDQKLLELLQELKMVRALQKRINDRTLDRAKQFPGEQANDPQVVRELRNLGERQLRIQQIVADIAKGANK